MILTALKLPRPGERWLLDPVPAEGQLLPPPPLHIESVSRGQLNTWLREELTLGGEREVWVKFAGALDADGTSFASADLVLVSLGGVVTWGVW